MKNFIDKLQRLSTTTGFWWQAFNGAVVSTLDGDFVFENGMLRSAAGVHNLVANRVTGIKWPVDVSAPEAKVSAPVPVVPKAKAPAREPRTMDVDVGGSVDLSSES